MSEAAVLIWAAGGPRPQEPDYDESLLLSAIRAHHLEIRLERRLEREWPDWATKTLRAGVADLAHEVRARARLQYAALRELLAKVDGPARPILIKGLSYRLLSGRDHTLTRSIDLDLTSRDLPALRDALVDLGYLVDPKDPPEPFGRRVSHEYAKLIRGKVMIDIHSRFPAWRYPMAAAISHSTSPAANSHSWTCIDHMIRGEIPTESLFARRIEIPGFDQLSVPVAGQEMTALVGCCHIFANYVTEFPAQYATIRLGELANIAELTNKPSFDWGLFKTLAAEHDAADAVSYASALIRKWFGAALRQPDGARLPDEPVPPRSLWFARGGGVFLVSTADIETAEDVIVRSTTTADLIRCLGEVAVQAAGNDKPRWYGAFPETTGIPLGRVLTQVADGVAFEFGFRVRWNDNGLHFTVCTPKAMGTEVNVLCYFGGAVIEYIEHPDGELFAYDRIRERRIASNALPFRHGANDTERTMYEVSIPWERLPARSDSDEIPMLLGVRRWRPDGDVPLAGTLCPLRLMRPR
jgi:hypothetical protein